MAAAIKTPGVYIQELNAFPNSVVEVPTAVPAFIGYTETQPTPNIPTRITSLAEFHSKFGGAPKTKFSYTPPAAAGATTTGSTGTTGATGTTGGTATTGGATKPPSLVSPADNNRFLMYYGMRLFFDNGGGPCWIVSIGKYDYTQAKDKEKFKAALGELKKIQEPTMLVAPDAVLLDRPGWQEVCQQMLLHCQDMQSRVSILDVFQGDTERTYNDSDDVITLFRNAVTDNLNYGQAYYPWVKTSIVDDPDVDYSFFDDTSLAKLKAALDDEAKTVVTDASSPKQKALLDLNAALIATPAAPVAPGGTAGTSAGAGTGGGAAKMTPIQAHLSLFQVSKTYKDAMKAIKDYLNVQPPSAGMAGVYTRIDNLEGVFKAPANTGMNSVIEPCVNITRDDQEDLNVPLNGKAVNAIRSFVGRGTLIWGARTLDGNSQDWRYINVRRTIIMLEQSCKNAALAYVFAPNNASTWLTLKNMISNFLTNQWKAGALVGATREEAFSVDVGLGATMTSDDILDGYMRVTVKVALVRPAEFIVITFQQKQQTS